MINQIYFKYVYLINLKFIRKSKLILKDEDKNQFYFKPLVRQVCENLIKTAPSSSNTNNNEQLLDIEYRTASAGNEGFNLFKSFKLGFDLVYIEFLTKKKYIHLTRLKIVFFSEAT
jgi:hypothetical protein